MMPTNMLDKNRGPNVSPGNKEKQLVPRGRLWGHPHYTGEQDRRTQGAAEPPRDVSGDVSGEVPGDVSQKTSLEMSPAAEFYRILQKSEQMLFSHTPKASTMHNSHKTPNDTIKCTKRDLNTSLTHPQTNRIKN
ncbi:hypothetical protein Dimus_038115 [Dionaea muscipula]